MEPIKLSEHIQGVIDLALEIGKTSGSRELSLTITKLEEAKMWLLKVEV